MSKTTEQPVVIDLTDPQSTSDMTVHDAIATRRSRREFTQQTISDEHLANLCWAAQGITDKREGLLASPSAGAIYPMTLMLADHRGVFEYLPKKHALRQMLDHDVRLAFQRASLDQECVGGAPVCMIIVCELAKLAAKYGDYARPAALLEAGHIAQNVLLEATSLGLAGVPVGAFHADRCAKVLELPAKLEALYLLPLGHPSA